MVNVQLSYPACSDIQCATKFNAPDIVSPPVPPISIITQCARYRKCAFVPMYVQPLVLPCGPMRLGLFRLRESFLILAKR